MAEPWKRSRAWRRKLGRISLADRHLNSPGSDLSLSSPCDDVSDRGIERHGAKVGRILYYQLLANNAPRHVLVYMTAAGLVTDEDVIGD